MPPDLRIQKMVPFSNLHFGGTEIRGVQILPDCIGDSARVSKAQMDVPMWFLHGESALFGEQVKLKFCNYHPRGW